MLLHDILVRSTKRNPNKIAVRCGNNELTYSELDELSNKLCHCLIDQGVTVGDRVCIYLDKSIHSLISIFGILKAGAVYVPIDPGAPSNRVVTIIQDSKPTTIISSSRKMVNVIDIIPKIYTLILCGNNSDSSSINYRTSNSVLEWCDVLKFEASLYVSTVIENDPAYILYTSGSTGIPKGVVISHRASLVFVEWACNEFQLSYQDIISNHAPLHFDLSIFDIYSTLMIGGTVILISPDISLFPYNLSSLISKSRISVWYSVPSMLVKMILYGKLDQLDFSNLRLVLFAGEIFPTKYLQQLINIIPHASFYNLYGPTETNVCTYYKVDKDTVLDPLPIGKPCPYNRFLLTNPNITDSDERYKMSIESNIKQGELCIQGPNVMSGYWNKENNDHKLQNVFYHTGDFVKQNNTGDLIYLSRIDGMIKSRGYRIELEEIESVLHSHTDISRAVVVPVPDLESTNLIHAFILLHDDGEEKSSTPKVNEKIVKNFCSKYLPRYMVPAFVTFISEIPETHNGKVNRIKLKELAMRK